MGGNQYNFEKIMQIIGQSWFRGFIKAAQVEALMAGT